MSNLEGSDSDDDIPLSDLPLYPGGYLPRKTIGNPSGLCTMYNEIKELSKIVLDNVQTNEDGSNMYNGLLSIFKKNRQRQAMAANHNTEDSMFQSFPEIDKRTTNRRVTTHGSPIRKQTARKKRRQKSKTR